MQIGINAFHATDLFLYPLKTLENFSDNFSGGVEIDQLHEKGEITYELFSKLDMKASIND